MKRKFKVYLRNGKPEYTTWTYKKRNQNISNVLLNKTNKKKIKQKKIEVLLRNRRSELHFGSRPTKK
jgi:hypothetical protein